MPWGLSLSVQYRTFGAERGLCHLSMTFLVCHLIFFTENTWISLPFGSILDASFQAVWITEAETFEFQHDFSGVRQQKHEKNIP